jgi:hypothetical protein
MIARCIGNSTRHVSADAIESFSQHVHQDLLPLVIDRDYIVYGVLFRDGRPWYLVCEEQDDDYPKPHFGQLFSLVDDRVPAEWSINVGESNLGAVSLLPTIWARDPRFLEKLLDEVPAALEQFRALKGATEQWHALPLLK